MSGQRMAMLSSTRELIDVGLLRPEEFEERYPFVFARLTDAEQDQVFLHALDGACAAHDVAQAHEGLDRVFRINVVPRNVVVGQKREPGKRCCVFWGMEAGVSVMLVIMQQWEYRIFASHLDPADLVVIMNESGKEGWELVAVVAVTDYQPVDLIEPDVDPENADEVVQLEAFRYVFKRPVS